MDKSILSVISALVGASSAVIVLALKSRAERLAEYRQTNRERIAPQLEDLGEVLYQIVSSVVLLVNNEKNKDYYQRLNNKNIRQLRILRKKLRYQLWGLDEGFKALLLLPSIVSENKNTSYTHLLNTATSLRKVLDESIRNCHLHGRPPNFIERQRVRFYVWRIKSIWEEYKLLSDIEDRNISNFKTKNLLKHKKTQATITQVNDSTYTAEDDSGNQYRVNTKYRSGRGSRSLVSPGVKVNIYKRPGEEFYRYTFVAPASQIKTN